MFEIVLGPAAQRFLKKADTHLYQRILEKIRELASDPFPHDVKRVLGKKEKVFRVRVGDYRIQYVLFYETHELLISDIDKRSRAYE
ncbi:MAG: type II toxin-antitoxin system RelE/ParE family toxin [Candidatus Aenigmarchaeota archaeon]|nr:type II toxin-antitoxin system RelE/ParE family toxin [Candidatus Aenigmarchaeota archaeon]